VLEVEEQLTCRTKTARLLLSAHSQSLIAKTGSGRNLSLVFSQRRRNRNGNGRFVAAVPMDAMRAAVSSSQTTPRTPASSANVEKSTATIAFSCKT